MKILIKKYGNMNTLSIDGNGISYSRNENLKLKQNLQFAEEAILYTQSVLPWGAANNTPVPHAPSDLSVRLKVMRRDYNLKISTSLSGLEIDNYKIISESAIENKFGNCLEQSCVAYTFLREQKNIIKVDKASIQGGGGDHAFVIIGRIPDSQIDVVETWGEKAVICDPWADEFYPASDFFQRINQNKHHEELFDEKFNAIGFDKCNDIIPPFSCALGLIYAASRNPSRQGLSKLQIAERLVANDPDIPYREYINLKYRQKAARL
jgi:hypothetical protein